MNVYFHIFFVIGVAYAQQSTNPQNFKNNYDYDYDYYYDYYDDQESQRKPSDSQLKPKVPENDLSASQRYQSSPAFQSTQPTSPPSKPSQPVQRYNRVRQRDHVVVPVETDKEFICPKPFGYFPHSKSCDRYWACENGTAFLKLCGNGLVFDNSNYLQENCAYLFSVNCGQRTNMEPPISTPHCPRLYGVFEDESNCRVFYSCWNGVASRFECPPGLAYHPEQRVCVWADEVRRCDELGVQKGFVCPDPYEVTNQQGLYSRHAHPTDCRNFYVCVDGFPRPYGCEIGKVFNADSLQCDYPENVAGCENYYADLDIDPKKLTRIQG
ncbi:protein obstructor-E-like [Tachypleus tridentatus]|uniref:protein obstructor-E-like n=1 Tax=Tachypleus tridentatus TaxID=6853 RepID=UPI003FD68C14